MQLTISSDDRLEDVLRVLSALHQVDLGAEIQAAAASVPAAGVSATQVADAEVDGEGYRTKTRHGRAY